jgi:hypothetical protein
MKFFKKVKTITSKEGELHFERWAIFESKWLSWYIHRIHKADRDHLHSYPWNFLSLILKGCYLEENAYDTADGSFCTGLKIKSPFTVTYCNKSKFHKINTIISGPVYTTMFVWGDTQKWFYRVGKKRIPFEEYREIKAAAKEAGLSIEEYIFKYEIGLLTPSQKRVD